MSLVAILPAPSLNAANAALAAYGPGPHFSVAGYGSSGVTHGVLHTWGPAAYRTAIKALAGVVTDETGGSPSARAAALISAASARWGNRAANLPTSGNAIAGTLYRYNTDELWWCIQTFSRTTFNQPPATYPALIRRARIPGEVLPWVQPIDQFDAYKLVNPFTGLPDQCIDAGQVWKVSQADGAGLNVWQPGVFGWTLA